MLLTVDTVEPVSKSAVVKLSLMLTCASVGLPNNPAGVLTLLLLGTCDLAEPMGVPSA